MATYRKSIIGNSTIYAPTPGTITPFPDKISNQLTALTNTTIGDDMCIVIPDPAGNGDHGLRGKFEVPQNYSSATTEGKIIAKFLLDGTPGASTVFPVGAQCLSLADNEAADAAFSTEDTGSVALAGGSYADEDQGEVEITLSISTGAMVAGDTCHYFWFWDDSAANPYGGNILLLDLLLEYADA